MIGGVRISDNVINEISNKEVWYWICNLPGIGQKKLTRLLETFSSPMDIYTCNEANLHGIEGLRLDDISTILHSKSLDKIRKSMQSMERKQISFFSYEDVEYPSKLRNIYDPPYGLYSLGLMPDPLKKTIAIIGARDCSYYGREVAHYFGKRLAEAGIQIISGMARGIDTFGHVGALEAEGYTLAVLGSGIDYCYPKENIDLYMRLEKEGGILSEYGLGVVPKAGHFPLRNRIISGLCDGILIIEARGKSGSLITADQGLEQGKDVFSIPGRISDPLSVGTNQLIKLGAEIITSPEEILEYYHIIEDNHKIKENKDEYKNLSEEERLILGCMSLDPVHISILSEQLTFGIGELMKILLQLEMKNLITQTSKNYYIKVSFES